MGLFDSLKKADTTRQGVAYSPENEQDAWIAILYVAAKADGDISDKELEGLIARPTYKTCFNGHSITDYFSKIIYAYGPDSNKAGQMLADCAPVIKPENRDLVFLMAVELVFTDNVLTEAEQSTIEAIREALDVPEELAKNIVDVYLIRNRYSISLAGVEHY